MQKRPLFWSSLKYWAFLTELYTVQMFLCPKLIRERTFVMVIWYLCRSQPVKKTWGKAGSKPIQKQEEQKPAEPISLKKATPIDKAPIEKTKVRMSLSYSKKNPSNVPHPLNLLIRWQLLRLIRIIFELQNALIDSVLGLSSNKFICSEKIGSVETF